jgi:tetratricopeptide (TPR) repeat protein
VSPHSLLTGLLFTAAGLGCLPTDESVLAEAEAAFRAQDFRRAAEHYSELWRRGVHNADLAHNLGNARMLAGDLPAAILAYRRGLRLAPHDPTWRAHLSYAREQVAYPTRPAFGQPLPEHWPPWLPRPSPGFFLWLSILAYALACVFGTRWLMMRQRRYLIAIGVASAVALLFVAMLFLEEASLRDELQRPVAVIREDGVLLRAGNGSSYPPRYSTPLHRGVEARVLFTKGDWLQIELSAGETGWIQREQALIDQV